MFSGHDLFMSYHHLHLLLSTKYSATKKHDVSLNRSVVIRCDNVFIFLFQNPLKLAHEIVRSDFAEIDARYSKGIRSVVNAMLDKASHFPYIFSRFALTFHGSLYVNNTWLGIGFLVCFAC